MKLTSLRKTAIVGLLLAPILSFQYVLFFATVPGGSASAQGGCEVSSKTFLSQVLGSNPFFESSVEIEPNNSYRVANGLLRSNTSYLGYPNDQSDLFSFNTTTYGPISISVQGHVGQGVQVALYYGPATSQNIPVAENRRPPFYIDYTGPAGTYYVFIYTEAGFNQTTPYTLRVVYPTQTAQPTAAPSVPSPCQPSPTPTITPTPTTPPSAIGYNFEVGTQSWTSSEAPYKPVTFDTSTDVVYSGSHSLRVTTDLYVGDENVFQHTEALVYFPDTAPEGISSSPPYNLTGKQVSCFVFMPSGLVPDGSNQGYLRLFVKDDVFHNQYGEPIGVTVSNVAKWLRLSLTVGVGDGLDQGFNAKRTNALGVRIDLYDNSSLRYSGPLYIDHCAIE